MLRFGVQPFAADQFEQVDIVQHPIMAARDFLQLRRRFRQGDVKTALSLARAFQQELQRDRRLTAAGRSFQQIGAIGRKAATQNIVQVRNAG